MFFIFLSKDQSLGLKVSLQNISIKNLKKNTQTS